MVLNIVSACLFIFVVLVIVKRDSIFFWKDEGAGSGITLASIIEIISLTLLVTQCRRIEITDSTISFANPLFSGLQKTFSWKDYDYYVTVVEYSQGKDHEAIWFIKNQRIKSRISSFYYSNYLELKKGIKIENMGQLALSPIKQLAYLLGQRVKNIA
jgi:hypothetical protein